MIGSQRKQEEIFCYDVSYDSLNRLLEIDYPNDPDIVYHYDGILFTLPGGSTVNPPDANAKGRLTGVQVGDSTGDPHTYYTTYQYNTRGNVVHSDCEYSSGVTSLGNIQAP